MEMKSYETESGRKTGGNASHALTHTQLGVSTARRSARLAKISPAKPSTVATGVAMLTG